jgi:hypothetical protein
MAGWNARIFYGAEKLLEEQVEEQEKKWAGVIIKTVSF